MRTALPQMALTANMTTTLTDFNIKKIWKQISEPGCLNGPMK